MKHPNNADAYTGGHLDLPSGCCNGDWIDYDEDVWCFISWWALNSFGAVSLIFSLFLILQVKAEEDNIRYMYKVVVYHVQYSTFLVTWCWLLDSLLILACAFFSSGHGWSRVPEGIPNTPTWCNAYRVNGGRLGRRWSGIQTAVYIWRNLLMLIFQFWSAFVRGRFLHDNFMLVQCMARRLHALKDPTILVKLDISKAFDSVQWPFLLEVMVQLGFGRRWTSWILRTPCNII